MKETDSGYRERSSGAVVAQSGTFLSCSCWQSSITVVLMRASTATAVARKGMRKMERIELDSASTRSILSKNLNTLER